MQASTEWTQVNEAKRLLVLGDAAVQENCSAEQRQQQDGNETQDAHTTGSPVPPAQLQQPSTALQPVHSSATPALAPTALGRLFQPPHTNSVLDVKVCVLGYCF